MTDAEVQKLFQKFAAPLAPSATTAARMVSAESLAKTLWMAMIGGPEMEEETWEALKGKGKLDNEMIEAIQKCYYEKMLPEITEDDFDALRQRYQPPGKSST